MIPSPTSQQVSEPRRSSQRETAGHHARRTIGTHRIREHASVTVVSTRGIGGIGGITGIRLGRAALKVLHHSGLPVALIPPTG